MQNQELKLLKNSRDIYLYLAYSFRLPSLKEWETNQKYFLNRFSKNKDPKFFDFCHRSIQNYRHCIKELIWEYTRLFIGPYHLNCPPYESIYRDDQRLVMSKYASEVWKFYDQIGLTLRSNLNELPDHISLELEFVSELLARAIRLKKERDYYLKLKNKFLAEHILKWIPQFCHDVEAYTKLDYYRELAKLCDTHIRSENI